MARQINRLNARKVQTIKKIGRHADGGGLYFSVAKDGGRKWVFLYRRNGRLREMGLGSGRSVPLSVAREKAAAARLELANKRDPLAQRQANSISPAFSECMDRFLSANETGWKNVKHAAQWRSTLETYACPVIGRLPVQDIGTGHITKILEPIWGIKTETASRLRGRIENILDWATARGYRTGENPARWRGHLDKLLPQRSKVQKVNHHPALPYANVATFLGGLENQNGVAAKALAFTVLTAARTNEVIGATRGEFDLASKIWTIPSERMKAGREHRVPLSAQTILVLAGLGIEQDDGIPADRLIFLNPTGKMLSSDAMLALLERMERTDITVHGFRSSFRDWAAETTNFLNEVVEMALAHTIKNKAEAAYRRGDLLEKRRELMTAWADYCEPLKGNKRR